MNMRHLGESLLIFVLLVALLNLGCSSFINKMLPSDSRPDQIDFEVVAVSNDEFDKIANELASRYDGSFDHIERFREQGILSYEGPKTCLQCHREISITDAATGEEKTVGLMKNLTTSAHYRFYTEEHPNVYGFNGKLADNFKMGKINRPCPKPGSFAMTAWAELAETKEGHTLSEGCGQCHIGGQYQAPLGDMMPFYGTTQKEKDAIDCLICHSIAYDMNQKQLVVNEEGRGRWDQDRSMKAAMAVGTPTAQACLRCHQHNFGGDIYIDQADSSYMQSQLNLGHERPRVAHPGSKRGTPFSPSWDVHAAASISCIECHTTEGHYIAKGTHTTTMMANDLPHVEVACENCHTTEPHNENEEIDDFLNGHIELIACQTCHIPSLQPDNATRRDFANPVFEEDHGIYVYDDIEKETEPGSGIAYAWWNGDGTFLGNPIGDNPNGENLYRFYKPTYVWPEYQDFDYEAWYERVMRPIAKKGRPSKLYAMKKFNGRQHIDLQNMGPFGGMYLPYNLPTYYKTGDPDLAVKEEMKKSMMKKMYGWMFDVYMMNKFMTFMDDGSGDYIDGWDRGSYDDAANVKEGKVDPRWIPQDALMEISHSIRLEGSLTCTDCHSPDGVLDWKELGYNEEDVEMYQENPLE
ncbi:MAG: hypothetical protein B6244_07005 [Candidatus Cloacimonetes bacterium 4572_55]|nr:MAG: hypothetical protein B6244_07005 [Candidatus Cloacimonetes bacterium 4572_55]